MVLGICEENPVLGMDARTMSFVALSDVDRHLQYAVADNSAIDCELFYRGT